VEPQAVDAAVQGQGRQGRGLKDVKEMVDQRGESASFVEQRVLQCADALPGDRPRQTFGQAEAGEHGGVVRFGQVRQRAYRTAIWELHQEVD
jgi:hypothetical protein